MKFVNLTLFALGTAVLSGCPSKPNEAACSDTKPCKVGFVCKAGACEDYVDCLELQATANACVVGQKCTEGLEGAFCESESGCRVASDCAAGQVCINGQCGAVPTTAVASCEITNVQRTFAPNSVIEITAAAYDSAGRYIPYQTFTVSGAGGFSAGSAANVVTADAQASASNGTVTATFGSTSCDAQFTNLGHLPASTRRVTLYKSATGTVSIASEKISGLASAFVITNASGARRTVTVTEGTGVSAGTYTFPADASDVAITIAAAHYNYVTVYFGTTTTANDLTLPLEPYNATSNKGDTSGFGGEPKFTNYDAAFNKMASTADVRAAYAGGSLPLASLLNFNFTLFTGDTAKLSTTDLTSGFTGQGCTTPISATAMGNVSLPRSLYLGNANGGGFGPNCGGYASRVVPGRRVGWSLGVKLALDKVSTLIGLASNPSVDNILKSVLPLADTIVLGVDPLTPSYLARKSADLWEAFASKPTAQQKGDPDFGMTDVNPGNRLFNIVNFTNPGLVQDFFPEATAADKLTGMVNLIAAISPVYGIVPIGFGAGFDGNNDGQLDRLSETDPRFEANKIHSRHTYLQSDIADAEVMSVLVAANFQDLTAKDDAKKSQAVRVKGMVTRDKTSKIGWSKNSGTLGDLNSAVQGFSTNTDPKYTNSGNIFNLPALTKRGSVQADAVIVRLDRDDDALERFWNILIEPGAMPADGVSIVLNTTGMDDIFTGGNSQSLDIAVIGLDFNDTASSLGERLSPQYGRDLEQISGDVKSFSLYYERADKL